MEILTISRLADQAGVHVETIRYYERRGLLAAPSRSAAGYRQYEDSARWRLEFIQRAKLLGFTLSEIADLFGPERGRSADEVIDAAHARLAAIEDEMRTLAAQRCQLRRLLDVCRHGDGDACLALQADAGNTSSAAVAS
jgi:MerR family mercuric resistance operon transcriptional regulator